jgi:predicted glutamine amidotransferase
MCRLLAVVATAQSGWRRRLVDAPRSLRALSHEHPHGWGVAVHHAVEGWRVERQPRAAFLDDDFATAADRAGTVLLAHVRQGTVGEVATRNTHPFRRGRWVFMHNGTIESAAWMRDRSSRSRIDEIEGQTDSEQLFAWLLSRLDDAGLTDAPCSAATDAALREALREARAARGSGAINVVLSDGRTVYAHRWGRTLFLRGDGGATVSVASEPEDGAAGWSEVGEGSLVRIDHAPELKWTVLDGATAAAT